jgi:CelD/BcsL family acetyltransferase involved in cellulose biosynthesis
MPTTCVDPRTDPLWQQLVTQQASSAFHSPAWMRVLAGTYGLDVRAIVLLDESGRPRAGIPFCRISDIMGERIVSLPFSDFCDPVVSQPDDWSPLVGGLLAERCPVSIRCLHNRLPCADERFALVKQARWHGADLRPDRDTLWRRLHDSSRRAVHKAQRQGVVVRVARGAEELRAFHDMHVKVRKYKYHLLAQPYAFFESIWRNFVEEQRGTLLLAIHEEKIISGVMLLEWQDVLYYKFNASTPAALSLRPNDLLMWETIQHGKDRNCSHLDLGLSDWDQEGLIRYKRKFATCEGVISSVQHSCDAEQLRRQGEMRGMFGRLTHAFSDASVPDEVSRTAGELLYRFLA